MSGDQRLFHYPLDLQLERLRWRLDEQLGELSRSIAEVEPLRAQRDALATEVAAVARDSSLAQARRMDPARARLALDYLATLQRQHASMADAMLRAERQVGERREAVAATQSEIDKLERDRLECLGDHVRETARSAQRETDQAWSARAAWSVRNASEREAQP